MARIDDIERRLENWARWRIGSTGIEGYAGTGFGDWAGEGTSAYREARIPTSAVEAELTDRAVTSLHQDLRHAVYVYYLQPEGYVKKALLLGCSVRVMYLRIEQAHIELQRWFDDYARQRQAERERVDRLQRGFYSV